MKLKKSRHSEAMPKNLFRRNVLTLILSVLCAALLFCSVGLLGGTNNKIANVYASTSNDTVIQLTLDSTNLAPTAQSGKMFSGEGLTQLYEAILGTNYENVATYNKLKKALTNSDGTTTQTWTSASSSATTTVQNAFTASDIRSKNGGNIQVNIGSTAFDVVYVTLNNNGDVIVDLWQAESSQTAAFAGNASTAVGTVGAYSVHSGRNNDASTRPSGVYGNSYIRTQVLGNAGAWDAFSGQASASTSQTGNSTAGNAQGAYAALWNSMTTGALSSFIDTPADVKYQEVESLTGILVAKTSSGGAPDYWKYTLPGDAYGIPYDEWYHDGSAGHYTNAGVNTGFGGNGTNPITGQDQWKNDKIWLPSLTETGYSGVTHESTSAVSGIWDLDNAQRCNTGYTGEPTNWNSVTTGSSWLRSGGPYSPADVFFLTPSGNTYSGQCHFQSSACSLAVRPALHLNLSKAQAAADATRLPVPQNVTVDYDGNAKWIDALATLTDTNGNQKFAWIDASLHNDPSVVTLKKIEYTDYDALGVQITANKDVTASGSANILNAGKYDITLEIPSSSTDYKWRDGTTGEKKFSITITQKSVPYTLQINGSTTPSLTYKDTITASVSQTAVTPSSLLTPVYELWYAGTGTTAASYPASKTAPTEAGDYSLTLKAKEDTANAGKNVASNYKLTGSALNFTIKPIEKAKLNSPAKQPYDGQTKNFTINGFDPTLMTAGKVNASNEFEAGLPTGLTLTGTTFTVTDAGKYTVAIQLPLDSTDGLSNRNYVWQGETKSFITVDLEVEQRTLEVDWDLLTGQTNWTIPVTATGALTWNFSSVADNAPVSGENVKLQYRYYYTSDGDTTASSPADSLDVKDIHDKNGATSRPQGSYTIELVIADNTAVTGGVDGKNYKMGNSGKLIITLGAGKADLNGLIKQVATGSALPVDYDGLSNPLEYTIAAGTEAVVTQKFTLGWPTTVDYIELNGGDAAYTYEKWDGSAWVNESNTSGAGKYKVTVDLKIVSGKDYTFDSALIGSTTAKGFKVESVAADELSATISFEVEIAKKAIDTSGFKLQYSYDQATWKDFDTEYKTEYVGMNIYVRVNPDTMKPAVAGITAKFGPSKVYDSGKNKQQYSSTATFTLTDNDNYTITDKPFTWEITNKQIKVDTSADWEPVDFNIDGVDYIGEILGIKGHSTYYPNAIEYSYSWYPESAPTDTHTGTGEAELKNIFAAASDTNKLKVTVTVKIKPSVTDYELVGAAQTSTEFTVGSDKTPITAATAEKAVYGEITDVSGFGVTVTEADGTAVSETGMLGEIYAIYLHEYDGLSVDTSVAGSAGTLLKDVDFANLNAGKYVIEIRLSTVARESYSLKNGKSLFEVERKSLAVPTVKEIIFTGSAINLEDYLEGFDSSLMELDGLYGVISGIKADTYGAVIRIKDEFKSNYIFVDGNSGETVTAKFVFADESPNISITDNGTVASFDWTISPYVLDAASLWNLKGKNGASLNMPQQFAELLQNPELLSVNYAYSETKGGAPLENAELKGGKTFYVGATIDGEYKDCFVFKDSGTQTSAQVAYTVPQSGASAFLGNAVTFFKSNWLWFLIGLIALILLIILIVIIAKRRKHKEEREEKKRQKEEEKRRREEEREAAKEKQKAELELAKAKQEAELAKMKAEAAAAAGLGMAGMAAAQPQQAQQPVQQQQMPMQQPQQQPYPQPQMQQPYPQYPQYPQQMPQPQPAQSGDGGMMMALMQAQLAEMRAQQNAALKTELEIMKTKLDGRQDSPAYRGAEPTQSGKSGISAELLGDAIIFAISKVVAGKQQPADTEPKVVESEPPIALNAPTVYPPDAVVTTTTTVDTTSRQKESAPRNSARSNGRARDNRDLPFDIDGFYDAFDESK